MPLRIGLVSSKKTPKPELPDQTKWNGPNHIPLPARLFYSLGSTALIIYGTYGVYFDDIVMPVKRSALHFSGSAAWFLYGAMLCAAANPGAIVIDHFDRWNNELGYAHFAAATQWLGWALFLAALLQKIL